MNFTDEAGRGVPEDDSVSAALKFCLEVLEIYECGEMAGVDDACEFARRALWIAGEGPQYAPLD